jgi:CHAD domain-containing protein
MNVDMERALKSLHRLRTAMKDLSGDTSPEQIHRLRTQARRLEAIVHALSPGEAAARRLLKLVKPVRKASGKVRDMDVLLAKLFDLSSEGAEEAHEPRVRLGEHLARVREQHLDRLCRVVERRRKPVRRLARRYARHLKKEQEAGIAFSPAACQVLMAELEHWPKLHAENLHEFRIRAKELRYMLQLAPSVEPAHMEALTATKDATGDWHDWLELRHIASEVLDNDADHDVLRRIESITRDKLRTALTTANRLRSTMFPARQPARQSARKAA